MPSITSLTEQPIDWPALMAQYEQSALDRKQFCQANNLSLRQFKYQRAKLKRQLTTAHQSAFISIDLKADNIQTGPAIPHTKANDIQCQMTFKNGIQCQLSFSFTKENLKQVMEVLQAC